MRVGLLAVLCCFLTATSAVAAPTVAVEFVSPGSYTDANLESRFRGAPSRSVLYEIEAYLRELGRRYLAPDESLMIQILDIDLAGEVERPPGAVQDQRVMRGGAWPRINLRYVLEKNGKVVREAQEMVTSSSYYGFGAPGAYGSLPLEKRMLEDWFRRRFAH